MINMKFAFTCGVVIGLSTPMTAQMEVTPGIPIPELAGVLEGFGVEILNVEVQCDPLAYGYFTGTSELEIGSGLAMTSGKVDQIPNPPSFFMSNTMGYHLSDPDLPEFHYDACKIVFDCVPIGDTLLLNYTFASEEYPEWVCSGFNDGFYLLLSGPGIIGPYDGYASNIARIPGKNIPVAINTVNAGVPGGPHAATGCATIDPDWQDNSIYYLDNEDGGSVAFDGFTTNLIAKAVVYPGQTYRFKALIWDIGDGAWDSGVFFEAFSFRSTALPTGADDQPPAEMGILQDGTYTHVLLPPGTVGSIQVINNTGGLVRQARITGDRTLLDMSGLASGLYTVHVTGDRWLKPTRFYHH